MKRQIANSIMIAVICLALLITSTYAWFANNHAAESKGMEMQVDYDEISIMDFSIYRFDQDLQQITHKENDYVSMAQYDSIFTDRNINTALVYQIQLLTVYDDWETKYPELSLTFSCEDGNWDEDKTSNLIDIYVCSPAATPSREDYTYTGKIDTDVNPDPVGNGKLYYGVCDYINDPSNTDVMKDTFVEYEGKAEVDYKKNNMIEFSAIPYTKPGSDGIITIYFVVEYNPDLVEAQHVEHFSDIDITMSNEIKFASDITSVRVGFTK